jgi:sulfite reductase (ferredoxin)
MPQNKLLEDLKDELVVHDIREFEQNISDYIFGKISDDEFRSKRTSRGIYSQRQPGVQMIRIKLPLGKLSYNQLLTIADVAEQYASGLLHITTRQAIQLYGAILNQTPELWAKLEANGITLKGSGGNTVRNVTVSPTAGIDPNEPFDVTPYAYEVFKYFLHNPVSQEMGRKIKIAFSSSCTDTAFTYIHDIGFIPKTKTSNGITERGFKVLLGGGLGAQPVTAQVAYDFLAEDQVIPFIESVLRVFGRYGERTNRHKARLKFLIKNIGLEKLLELAEKERIAIEPTALKIKYEAGSLACSAIEENEKGFDNGDAKYSEWFQTNVFEQKQKGFYAVYLKIPSGDLTALQTRAFVNALKPYTSDQIVLTQNQGILLKFIQKKNLAVVYNALCALDLATRGFESIANITSCRGTNTCNLAITNSLAMSTVLENLIHDEYPQLVYNREIKIKVSGCMNSCGHHGLAHIGFHGSSIKAGDKVLPAVQVLLGGGTVGDGAGRIADKIIKIPVKRVTDAVRILLNDYVDNLLKDENFHHYYDRKGKDYFYQRLKHLSVLDNINDADWMDWGNDIQYKTAIGTGECAASIVDLADVIFRNAKQKLQKAEVALKQLAYADCIFYTYSSFIEAAKAALLKKGSHSSTQHGVITEFDLHFNNSLNALKNISFHNAVMQINKNEPGEKFAKQYLQTAQGFVIELESLLS